MATPLSHLAASLLVALGGGTGAVLRYQLGRLVTHLSPAQALAFPWATLTANALGSAAMGVLIAWLARHDASAAGGGEPWRLLLGVGLLGGFTTFSSFSMETVLLWQRGEAGLALIYIIASLVLGLAGLVAGLTFARGTL
ncbi:fluoride efflux transporter CrcB [Croceicoccus marinus]|jgi:CrcB protein|uniref:Fluoride-specific ion channel FluC n=1 Tax=Croceicoccus marinus TaxID=450378 RepID=A0A7G6VT47_9SPHN|nr:fluoride efflux transporter CrcB [Croceicoccus marinus]QNE04912.1 fluoride efflux transporter CrcB [Croceicoccus marinus]